MVFDILHRTEYRYSDPATEAYMELRLTPPDAAWQRVLEHSVETIPGAELSAYEDYFGNRAHFFSMTQRHARLAITSRMRVETGFRDYPAEVLATSIGETRQLLRSMLPDVYDYLQGTEAVPVGGPARAWVARLFPPGARIGEAVEAANSAVHREFQYESGSTDNETPLPEIWKQRRGVCQDFAHILLSILRTGGLPCRYVCGYIESNPPKDSEGGPLLGAVATHAWVEVLLPGGAWMALDPTNNCRAGVQHVAVSMGRDFRDAAPVRGTFKTAGTQSMNVRVMMKRRG